METPTSIASGGDDAPAANTQTKGGIVGAPLQHPDLTLTTPPTPRTRHTLAWLGGGVLLLHLAGLVAWLSVPQHAPTTGSTAASPATGTYLKVGSPSVGAVHTVAPVHVTAETPPQGATQLAALAASPTPSEPRPAPPTTPPTTPPRTPLTTPPLAARSTRPPSLPSTPAATPHESTPTKENEQNSPSTLNTKEKIAPETIAPSTPPTTVATHDDWADTAHAPANPALLPVALKPSSTPTRATASAATPVELLGPLRLPPSAELGFDVTARRKGFSYPASSTLTWQLSANTYSAKLVIQAMFMRSRSQTSVGSVDPVLGLQPKRFGDKYRTEQATHFDRTQTPPVLRFSANAPPVPLQPQTQDRLSVLFQLAAVVAGSPQHHREGDHVRIHTAGSRDAETWVFRVAETELLTLPAGELNAVHLVREAQDTYDNRVDVWLAPDLGYLPVRILWTQTNGDTVEQALSSHQP